MDRKIRKFVPGKAAQPAVPVVEVTKEMRVRGRVRMPEGIARGVMVRGTVVAWAVARLPDEKGVRHITVETDVQHRRTGYAAACLQALVRDVHEPMVYECEESNLKSAKTALKAGFTEVTGG